MLLPAFISVLPVRIKVPFISYGIGSTASSKHLAKEGLLRDAILVCWHGRGKFPSWRKPREHLLCAVEMPWAQGNVGESAYLQFSCCLPAAPQERGKQKAKALLHLHSLLLRETEHL